MSTVAREEAKYSRHHIKDSLAVCGGRHGGEDHMKDPMMKWVDMPWSSCTQWKTHVGAQKKMNENRKEQLRTDKSPPFPISSGTPDEGDRRVRSEVLDLEKSMDREMF